MDLLKAMDSFVRVVRAGSFSGAAEQLGVSRAIVSKHVQFLEEHLAARLLNRSTRRLSLTEIGAVHHKFCVGILSQIEDERAAVTRLQSKPHGMLKVMAPKSFGNLLVAPAVADFIRDYPDLQVSLLLSDGALGNYDLIDHGFDVAVRLAPATESSLIARRIGATRWIMCAAPAYLAARGRPETPERLVEHNCLVHLKCAPDSVWMLEGPRGKKLVKVSGSFTANSSLAVRAAALQNLGIALLPIYSVAADIAAGRLIEVMPAYLGPERPIFALYAHRRLLPMKVRLLVDFLAERFSHSPVSYADFKSTHSRTDVDPAIERTAPSASPAKPRSRRPSPYRNGSRRDETERRRLAAPS
jgi:DNA-binding transcriptional LysR family regulator